MSYQPSNPINRTDARQLSGEAFGSWYWLNRWRKNDSAGGFRNSTKGLRAMEILKYRYFRALIATAPVETNERGNEIYRDIDADRKMRALNPEMPRPRVMERDRYFYDASLGSGWKQFDTRQDASYFGVWVNIAARMTFSYTEGDRTLVICPTAESFRAEMEDAGRFYGPCPPMARSFDADGTVTEYYDERPVAQ